MQKELFVLEKRRMDSVICIQMDRDSGNKKLDHPTSVEYKIIQVGKCCKTDNRRDTYYGKKPYRGKRI